MPCKLPFLRGSGACIADGISSVAVSAGGSGYTNGGSLTASCDNVANCEGTGFAGTCIADGISSVAYKGSVRLDRM